MDQSNWSRFQLVTFILVQRSRSLTHLSLLGICKSTPVRVTHVARGNGSIPFHLKYFVYLAWSELFFFFSQMDGWCGRQCLHLVLHISSTRHLQQLTATMKKDLLCKFKSWIRIAMTMNQIVIMPLVHSRVARHQHHQAPPSKDVYNVVLWLIPKIRRWRWQLLYLVPV